MAVFDSVSGMNRSSQAGLIIGIILIVLVSAILVFWVFDKKYSTLYADLNQQDAAAVVKQLEKLKIPYKLKDNGSRILIPEESVHEIRLKMAGSDVPLKGGIGFEIFDNNGFGMTDFSQKVNYQRALQGELSRTIMSFSEVKNARVHLVMPESSLFKKDKVPPRASVTVQLRDNHWLKQQQIRGIQRLVSSSVADMEMYNVTVVDQNGIVLSYNEQAKLDGPEMAVSNRLQRKQEVETYLMRKAQQVLEKAFGSGNAVVSVDVQLNLNKIKKTKEQVLQDKDSIGIVKKREIKQLTGEKKGKAGNVTKEVEYHLGRNVEQTLVSPGEIKRMSVAVLVPKNTMRGKIKQVKELVSMAVGLDNQRGDGIAVHAFDVFNQSPSKAQNMPAGISGLDGGANPPGSGGGSDGGGGGGSKIKSFPDLSHLVDNPLGDTNLNAEITGPSAWENFTEFLGIISGELLKAAKADPLLVGGAIGVFFVLIGIYLLATRERRPKTRRQEPASMDGTNGLSETEKQEVLVQIQEWLNKDGKPKTAGANG